MTMLRSAGGPVLTRRRFLQASAATTVAVTVAIPAATAARAAAPGPPPVKYGTPTDIARTTEFHTWTRQPDGSVVVYDKTSRIWKPWKQQDWAEVLTYGTAYQTRWGQPSGNNQLVVVLGVLPTTPPPDKPPPTTPPPTTPVQPPTTPPPTDTTAPPTTPPSTISPPSSTGASTTQTNPPATISSPPSVGASTSQTSGPHVAGGSRSELTKPPLAYTGLPASTLSALGVAFIGLGAGLTFLRRRTRQVASARQTGQPAPDSDADPDSDSDD